MKKKLLSVLSTKKGTNITDLRALLPDISGSHKLTLPTPEGQNKNIMLIDDVNEQFIALVKELTQKRKIRLQFVDSMVFIADGSPMYMPLAQEEDINSERECWLPVQMIKLAAKHRQLKKV